MNTSCRVPIRLHNKVRGRWDGLVGGCSVAGGEWGWGMIVTMVHGVVGLAPLTNLFITSSHVRACLVSPTHAVMLPTEGETPWLRTDLSGTEATQWLHSKSEGEFLVRGSNTNG
jgi:hypothetical protein